MICLRCGHCCKNYCVIIVDDPNEGIYENNLIVHEGHNKNCPHLLGDEPGKYSCAVHDEPWYEKTPCFAHGQIERSPDTPCRMGEYILGRKKGKK